MEGTGCFRIIFKIKQEKNITSIKVQPIGTVNERNGIINEQKEIIQLSREDIEIPENHS